MGVAAALRVVHRADRSGVGAELDEAGLRIGHGDAGDARAAVDRDGVFAVGDRALVGDRDHRDAAGLEVHVGSCKGQVLDRAAVFERERLRIILVSVGAAVFIAEIEVSDRVAVAVERAGEGLHRRVDVATHVDVARQLCAGGGVFVHAVERAIYERCEPGKLRRRRDLIGVFRGACACGRFAGPFKAVVFGQNAADVHAICHSDCLQGARAADADGRGVFLRGFAQHVVFKAATAGDDGGAVGRVVDRRVLRGAGKRNVRRFREGAGGGRRGRGHGACDAGAVDKARLHPVEHSDGAHFVCKERKRFSIKRSVFGRGNCAADGEVNLCAFRCAGDADGNIPAQAAAGEREDRRFDALGLARRAVLPGKDGEAAVDGLGVCRIGLSESGRHVGRLERRFRARRCAGRVQRVRVLEIIVIAEGAFGGRDRLGLVVISDGVCNGVQLAAFHLIRACRVAVSDLCGAIVGFNALAVRLVYVYVRNAAGGVLRGAADAAGEVAVSDLHDVFGHRRRRVSDDAADPGLTLADEMRRRRAADDTRRRVSSRFQLADDAAELAEAGRGRLGADVRIAVRDAAVEHRARDAAALDAAAGESVDHRFFDPDVFDRALDQTEQTEPVASGLHAGRRAAGNKHAGDRVAVAVKRAVVGKAHGGALVVPVGDRLPDAKTGRFYRPGLPVRRVVERNVGGQLCPGAAVFRGAVGQIAVDERGEPRKLLRRSDLVGRGLRAVADGRFLNVVAPVAPAAGDRGRLAGELFAGLVADVKRRGLHVFSHGDGRKFQRHRRVAHADARERDRVLLVAAGERIVGAEISRSRCADRRLAHRQLDGCVLAVSCKIAEDLARVCKAVDACNIDGVNIVFKGILAAALILNRNVIGVRNNVVTKRRILAAEAVFATIFIYFKIDIFDRLLVGTVIDGVGKYHILRGSRIYHHTVRGDCIHIGRF